MAQDITRINEYMNEWTRDLTFVLSKIQLKWGGKTIYICFFTDSDVFKRWLHRWDLFLYHITNIPQLGSTEAAMMILEKKDLNRKGLTNKYNITQWPICWQNGHLTTDLQTCEWLALRLRTKDNSLHQPTTAWATQQFFFLTVLPINVTYTVPNRLLS